MRASSRGSADDKANLVVASLRILSVVEYLQAGRDSQLAAPHRSPRFTGAAEISLMPWVSAAAG